MLRFFSFETIALLFAALIVYSAHSWVSSSDQPQVSPLVEETLEPDPLGHGEEIDDCLETIEELPVEFRRDPRSKDNRIIVVFKRAYRVGLYEYGKLVHEDGVRGCFPISLGLYPYEPKYKTDCVSTPEGWYKVASKNTTEERDHYPWTAWYKGLLVNYPNVDDIARARAMNTIDSFEEKKLLERATRGLLPPQNTRMGGQILIHGAWNDLRYATFGCAGMSDQNIDWLFERAQMGDPILFVPWRTVIHKDGGVSHDATEYEYPGNICPK